MNMGWVYSLNHCVSPHLLAGSCLPRINLGNYQPISDGENAVIEAVDPTHIHLTSMSYIYKVFDTLYMLWMCIWMCPHHVRAAHADHAFGILLEILVTTSQ